MQFDGKNFLVTGGTGTIGAQVVSELLQEGARQVIIYSRDQNKQFTMHHRFSSRRVVYKNGDICDLPMLHRAMKDVHAVVHCAASKHLPLCEQNSDSAIKINVEGTRNVLLAALQRSVGRCLLLSTDKAANPSSVMGATKFLAERLFLEFSEHFPCSIVRLGNVFASNGSVVPTFQDRLKNKLPLVVNNPQATRFFLTRKQAGQFIVERLKDMQGGEIFIRKMKWMRIQSLAEAIAPPGYAIHHHPALPGEKLHEELYTNQEATHLQDRGDYLAISKDILSESYELKSDEFSRDEIYQMLKGIL